jgi:hypothetical protein
MDTKFTEACLCGAVQYECSADPVSRAIVTVASVCVS